MTTPFYKIVLGTAIRDEQSGRGSASGGGFGFYHPQGRARQVGRQADSTAGFGRFLRTRVEKRSSDG